jgi:hypothetical protein
MTIERTASLAPNPDAASRSDSERTAIDQRRARLNVALALGGLVVLLMVMAAWLTFFRQTSTSPSMDMQGAAMGPSVCAVLPPSVVEEALGLRAAAPTSTTTEQTTTCRYRLGAEPGGLVVTYAMAVSPQRFQGSVSSLRALGQVSPIAALGDQAFGTAHAVDGRTTVLLRRHGNVVRIETTAPLPAATRLAALAAPQL